MSKVEQKYMGLWALVSALLITLIIGLWVWQVGQPVQAASSTVVETQ